MWPLTFGLQCRWCRYRQWFWKDRHQQHIRGAPKTAGDRCSSCCPTDALRQEREQKILRLDASTCSYVSSWSTLLHFRFRACLFCSVFQPAGRCPTASLPSGHIRGARVFCSDLFRMTIGISNMRGNHPCTFVVIIIHHYILHCQQQPHHGMLNR